MSEPVLCFIKDNTAYFTTQELSKQTGDDWDDAPYEHNAEPPYEPSMQYFADGRKEKIRRDWNEDGTPKWEIVKVMFESELITPAQWYHNNMMYSVEQINAKYVPWLATPPYMVSNKIVIHAGTSITEFKKLIKASGGKIYVEEKE
jgi:hypothetical protein